MGCRAVYWVVGASTEPSEGDIAMRLRTHWEGHPADAFVTLKKACTATEELDDDAPITAEFFVGQLLSFGTTMNGMTVQLEGDVTSCFFALDDERALRAETVLEWLYAIDLRTRSIWVYGAEGAMSDVPTLVGRGPVSFDDPSAFAQIEGDDAFEAAIVEPLGRFDDAGFTTNPRESFVLFARIAAR